MLIVAGFQIDIHVSLQQATEVTHPIKNLNKFNSSPVLLLQYQQHLRVPWDIKACLERERPKTSSRSYDMFSPDAQSLLKRALQVARFHG